MPHPAKLLLNSGSVISNGDNRTSEGDGDDKPLTVELAKVPANIDRLAFTISIYEFDKHRHNSEWKFKAIGQSFDGGLMALMNHSGAQ